MFTLAKIRILVLSIFLLLSATIFLVTQSAKKDLVSYALSQEINSLDNIYKTSLEKFNLISDVFHRTILNKDEILNLLHKAKYSKDDSARAIFRKKLYDKVRPHFNVLSKSGVNIMQFVFEDNKSFLRVHKPSKFGDDLTSIRYSIDYTNKNKKSIQGFEQGKISHAFRNVYPLFYKGEYLGSVDIAFSSETVQNNMLLLHNTHSHFILNKNIFKTNIWERQKKVKYIQSIENEDFLFSLTQNHNDDLADMKIDINEKLKKDIAENLKYNNSFSLYDGGSIVSFFAVKNIKENKTIAYLVSYVDSNMMKNIIHKHRIVNIIILITLLILYFVIINNIKQRFNLQERIEDELEKNAKQQHAMFNQSRLAQMGEMISMIAHQWRQPLNAITLTSLDLRMQLEFKHFDLEDEKGKIGYENYINNSLTNIEEYVENLTTTIDDFRNFYKINKEVKLSSLEDVCTKAIKMIDSSLKNDNIEIIYNCKSNNKIKIFKNEMVHVVLNILKNSQDNFQEKHIHKPMIKISTTNKTISICDNGGGISEEIIEKIFDPYFSTKDEKNGTGLGLYMSKLIIDEHHNGKLTVLNKDGGTCFKIKL